MTKWTFVAVAIGFLIDLLVGDPSWLYHPVRIIGNAISYLEKGLRTICPTTKGGERVAGVLLVVIIVSLSTLIPGVAIFYAYRVSFALGFGLETFMCYQLLAVRSLKTESMKVYQALKTGDIMKSRHAVSMIVGRDTQELSAEGITKATVETIAESTSDGVIAPLFYMMIGGATLGFFYKAINTMDSMIGYKSDRYQYFGTAAAKLDDIVNYLPARLAGLMMMVAAYLLKGFDGRNGKQIFWRDRHNHASPNSAQTEAVMAGALQIQLAGDACYFGKVYHKPTIGDKIRAVQIEDIVRANQLLYGTAILAVLILALIRAVVNIM